MFEKADPSIQKPIVPAMDTMNWNTIWYCTHHAAHGLMGVMTPVGFEP